MSRKYTTIDDQNWYDLVVQLHGSLDDMALTLREVPEINQAVPFGTLLEVSEPVDRLAREFQVNNATFATGMVDPPRPSSYNTDYNTDYGDNFDGNPPTVSGAIPYDLPHLIP